MSYLKWKRLCKTCGNRYAEIDNIGVHRCIYHSGRLNRNGPGKWHPEGCWECCGKSPYAYLPNGRRNPRYSSTFLHGCTRMDHSALKTIFCDSDHIQERDWPAELCEQLNNDIMKLRNGDRNIMHRGLRINDLGEFYIERYDRHMAMERKKHKYVGDERMTVEINYQLDSEIKTVVMERDKTVGDLLNLIGQKNVQGIDKRTKIAELKSKKVYQITTN